MEESTFERYRDSLERTTITEKLDYKTLLIHALRTVETSILSGDPYIIQSSIWTLYNLIPTNWHDKDFEEEIKKCYIKEKVDIRIEFCGVKPSLECCEERGIVAFKEITRIEHFEMLKACVCLLERLGVLMRRTPKAWIRGKSGVDPNGESSIH